MRSLFIRGGGISYKMIITQERLILRALDWTLYAQWNEICDQLDAADGSPLEAVKVADEPAASAAAPSSAASSSAAE